MVMIRRLFRHDLYPKNEIVADLHQRILVLDSES